MVWFIQMLLEIQILQNEIKVKNIHTKFIYFIFDTSVCITQQQRKDIYSYLKYMIMQLNIQEKGILFE